MSAEIRMFAYLKNFTLFACFLGLGLGMMRRKRSRSEMLLPILIATIVLILAFAPQLHLTRLFFPDVGVYQWGGNLHSPQLLPRRGRCPFSVLCFAMFPTLPCHGCSAASPSSWERQYFV
jgi:hypothetical protein